MHQAMSKAVELISMCLLSSCVLLLHLAYNWLCPYSLVLRPYIVHNLVHTSRVTAKSKPHQRRHRMGMQDAHLYSCKYWFNP